MLRIAVLALLLHLFAATSVDAQVLFVGLESEDAVAVVDPETGQVVKKIPVGISTEDIEGVHALATSPDGRYYYLSIAHGWPYGSVWKMDTDKGFDGAEPRGPVPGTMAITPDGTWPLVANYNLRRSALDTVSPSTRDDDSRWSRYPYARNPRHGGLA